MGDDKPIKVEQRWLDKFEVPLEVHQRLRELRDRGLYGNSLTKVAKALLVVAIADLVHKGILDRRPPGSSGQGTKGGE